MDYQFKIQALTAVAFEAASIRGRDFVCQEATLLHGDWMDCLASSNQSALLFQRTFMFPSDLKSVYLNYVVALLPNL